MTSPYYIELGADGLSVVHRETGETLGSNLEWSSARDLIWQKYGESLEFSQAMNRLYGGETTKALIQNNVLTTTEEPPARWSQIVLPLLVAIAAIVCVFMNAAQYEVSEDVPAPVYLDGGR